MKKNMGKRILPAFVAAAMMLGMLSGVAGATTPAPVTTEIKVNSKTTFDTLELKATGAKVDYDVTDLLSGEALYLDSTPPYAATIDKKNYSKDYGCVFVKYDASGDKLSITPVKAGSVVLYLAAGLEDVLSSELSRFTLKSNIIAIPITVTEEDLGIGYLMINNRTKSDTVTVKSNEQTKTLNISAMTSGKFLLIPQVGTATEPKVSDVVYPANFTTDFTYFTAKVDQTATGGTMTITPKMSGTGVVKLYLAKTTEHGSLHVINKIMDTFTLSVGVEYTGPITEKVSINLANQTYGSSEIALRYNIPETAIQWFSNDVSVATIVNGRIAGLKQGVTTMTAYIPSLGRMVEITVTVPQTVVETPAPITPTPTPTVDNTKYKFKIMASTLNMRQTPSTSAKKLGAIKRNVSVYGYFVNDDWVLVKAKDNTSIKQDCYIFAQYLMIQ